MNFVEYVLMMVLALNLLVFTIQAFVYMASNLSQRNYNVSRLNVLENKLYPHSMFYTATTLLLLLIANVYLHHGVVRSLIFVPFLLLVHSTGRVFQEKYNADGFN